jgi:transposase InsO family protein
MRTDLVLDALEQALWPRTTGTEVLVHHSDRGVQYLSIRYTERLAEDSVASSAGRRGDSYDNALAETIIGLFKGVLSPTGRVSYGDLTQTNGSPEYPGSRLPELSGHQASNLQIVTRCSAKAKELVKAGDTAFSTCTVLSIRSIRKSVTSR